VPVTREELAHLARAAADGLATDAVLRDRDPLGLVARTDAQHTADEALDQIVGRKTDVNALRCRRLQPAAVAGLEVVSTSWVGPLAEAARIIPQRRVAAGPRRPGAAGIASATK
jgi:hypothetical protein